MTPRTLDVTSYREELLGLVAPGSAIEVPLGDGTGHHLAEDLHAQSAVPAFVASAMDGYAARWEDLARAPIALPVLEDIPAGHSPTATVTPGTCARIMTGAPLPQGADTVVPVELTDAGAAVVTITTPPRGHGAHIRGKGEDVSPGDLIAPAGWQVRPGIAASAAASGVTHLRVRRRPRVVVASTGSELRLPGDPLAPGQIHESNSWFVGGSLRGAEVTTRPALPDDAPALRTALDEMTAGADLVVLSGGAGGGAHDVPGQVLSETTHHAFTRVLMQPGKPQGWAVWNGVPVLLLAGNPVAAAVSAAVFVQPVIDRMLGLAATAPRSVTARADFSWVGAPGRDRFLPAVLRADDVGQLSVTEAHHRGLGSHLVSALARANVLAHVRADTEAVHRGDLVAVIAFGGSDLLSAWEIGDNT